MRRKLAVFVALFVALSGCSAELSEAQKKQNEPSFLSDVRAIPVDFTQSLSDEALIGMGHDICGNVEKGGVDGVLAALAAGSVINGFDVEKISGIGSFVRASVLNFCPEFRDQLSAKG